MNDKQCSFHPHCSHVALVVEEPHSADAALILLVLNFSSKLTTAFTADEALTMKPPHNRG